MPDQLFENPAVWLDAVRQWIVSKFEYAQIQFVIGIGIFERAGA